jgi:hypothetical protein
MEQALEFMQVIAINEFTFQVFVGSFVVIFLSLWALTGRSK